MCFWQAISPLANSAVICVLELVHNKKMVLSVEKYHYFSFSSSSKLISTSPTTEDRSCSCCDYVQYALIVCECIFQPHVCLRACICMCMCGCVSPHETGLSVDRVFGVEPISRRDRGLWAPSAEPRFSSFAASLPLPLSTVLKYCGALGWSTVVSGLWFPFKISPTFSFSSIERVRNLPTDRRRDTSRASLYSRSQAPWVWDF